MKPQDRKRVMKEFRLSEISLVDSPMQEPALVAILKRADDDTGVQKRIAITSMAAGHAHSVLTANFQGGENRIGQTSYVDGHTHDWMMDEAGNIFIADAQGHNHGIAVLAKRESAAKSGVAVANENPDSGTPAAVKGQLPAGNNTAATSGAERNEMTPEQLAALQKAADESKAKIAELEKANLRSQSILKLSREQREVFDTLKTAEQDEFLSKTDEQKNQVIKNRTDANPVVFKALDGSEYRQSDDPRLVKMARDRDEDRKTIAREQAIRKQAELEKRATDELPNLGGEVAVKAALLGAVDGIPDATVRGEVLKVLKQQDAGLGKAFQRIGTGAAPNMEKRAADKLDDLAKAFAVANKCDISKAYDAVVRTEEGQRLYAEHRAGK